MKKSTFALSLIFWVFTCSVRGQFVSLTPKGGVTFSDFYTATYAKSSFKTGMTFGILADYKLNKEKLFVKGELGFEQKGTKYLDLYSMDASASSSGGSTYYTYNYINLPVLIKLKIGSKNNFFLNTGIYTGYLISGVERFKGTFEGQFIDQKNAMNMQNHNRLDFGLAIGGGVGIPIVAKDKIMLEARYDFALTTSNKSGSPLEPKQHTLEFTIGYEFGLKNK
ncbi:MAG: porin family protein [Bacteroidota bacterium]